MSNVMVVDPSDWSPYLFRPCACSNTDSGETRLTSCAAASETRLLETWSVLTTAPAAATERMLAHNRESTGSHDQVRLVTSSGTAAWTNSELQEVSSAGIATRDTAPIVVLVEVEVEVVEVVSVLDVVVVVVLVEVVNVLDVVLVVVVVLLVEDVEVSVADAVVTDVVVDVIVSVTLSSMGVLMLSTVRV
mmetsp:Transcript_19493/g.55253  ORF Transcript_19493/g.55253 Transcript_19493/m.55253 type:complete len:190 (+) Transcript_19493:212-781(+)